MENINKAYYAIIPANVRYDKELKANAKLLYGEITALSNEKGYCWATNSYFAELYNVSNETVSRWVSQLTGKGYIKTDIVYKNGTREIEQRRIFIGGNINTPIDEKINSYCQKGQDPIDEKINTPIDKKVKENNTSINNTINNNKKERKKVTSTYDEIINNYTKDPELSTCIIEFLKMRKLIKATMTDKALKLMLNKLDKLAPEDTEEKIAILNQSIENSWKGIFELKGEKSYGSSKQNIGQSERYKDYDFSFTRSNAGDTPIDYDNINF